MSASSLNELEDEYQLQRILDEGDVRARIDSVHVSDDSVYLTLIIGADYQFTLRMGASNPRGGGPQELTTLKPLCDELGFSFSRDLSRLVGSEVTIEGYIEKPEKIKIREGDVGYLPVVDEPPASERKSQRLSKNTYNSIHRYHRHEINEDEFTEALIADVTVYDDDLLLSLEVYGKLLRWFVDIPDGVIESGSKYATIVEKVGGGNVKQVEGSSVYVTPKHELGAAPDDYQNCLGSTSDLFRTWVIFPSREDIERPRLTPVARRKHTKNMSWDDAEPNNPDAWEKRPIPYSTAHRIEFGFALISVLSIPFALFIGDTAAYLLFLGMLGFGGVKMFKFAYYHTD